MEEESAQPEKESTMIEKSAQKEKASSMSVQT